MNEILLRIKQLSEYKGVTIAAIERQIGASKGVLSRAISNNTDIQAKWIIALVDNYPDINTEWLLTGKGKMFKAYEVKDGDQSITISSTDKIEEMLIGLLRKKDEQIDRLIALLERSKNEVR